MGQEELPWPRPENARERRLNERLLAWHLASHVNASIAQTIPAEVPGVALSFPCECCISHVCMPVWKTEARHKIAQLEELLDERQSDMRHLRLEAQRLARL